MPIEDGSPERRNLVVMSMSIIAFYVGGGTVDGAEGLSLPLVTLHFQNPELLGCLAWIVLFWFAFRYVIEYKYIIWNTAFARITIDFLSMPFYGDYLLNKYIKGKAKIEGEVRIIGWDFQELSEKDSDKKRFYPSLKFRTIIAAKIVRENTFKSVTLNKSDSWVLFVACLLQHFFSNRDISAYFGPLVLFAIAVTIGLIKTYQ